MNRRSLLGAIASLFTLPLFGKNPIAADKFFPDPATLPPEYAAFVADENGPLTLEYHGFKIVIPKGYRLTSSNWQIDKFGKSVFSLAIVVEEIG